MSVSGVLIVSDLEAERGELSRITAQVAVTFNGALKKMGRPPLSSERNKGSF